MSQSTTHRISDLSEIISILEQNPSMPDVSGSILIGARAAIKFLPNLRDKATFLDHDIIYSSAYLLRCLSNINSQINTIQMIIPSFNEEQLDLYVTYTLQNGEKFDFAVPRSITSYTAYLLINIEAWTVHGFENYRMKNDHYQYASRKLLLILKKYLLYYPNHWQKTASDYRQLLTVTESITENDQKLCHLFNRYNEKLHGPRPSNTDEFIIKSQKDEEKKVIKQDEFLQFQKDEQVTCVYEAARECSIAGDFLTGLEHICTKSPPWLVDFVIDHWIDIHNEKFKNNIRTLPSPVIQYEISNHRLFDELPELVMQKILLNITDPLDFYSMKLVCKRWYTIMNQPSFWQNLYTACFDTLMFNNTMNWKSTYLMKLTYQDVTNTTLLNQLVNTTLSLRRITANDVLQLWENLTHQNQSVDPVILLQIDYILSHSYYYHLSIDRGRYNNTYAAKLMLIGFEHPRSQSKTSIELTDRDDSSYAAENEKTLTVRYNKNTPNYHSLSFAGSDLFGFCSPGGHSYEHRKDIRLKNVPISICQRFPEGLIHCLFTMMVHPGHRAQFISYLRVMEGHCMRNRQDW